ncbi:WD40-repeat-containing domain protein [Fimicolochytrium jonesii]|uniref:WD40-repeat-containing domain protein n=1 Tax=Fimicolochytrium jonesii TaxID=1396493 RepID=UPI0022FEEB37|nr:WD40-repeat-containing domain protein [Fimicolochytrium jonesii]KAI8827259.1 WD40-repeat-containing domain protein [Fimicolochytrium jonesii]
MPSTSSILPTLSTTPQIHRIPHLTTQPDFATDLHAAYHPSSQPPQPFWLSLYNYDGKDSVHAKITPRAGGGLEVDVEGVQVEGRGETSFWLLHPDGTRTLFLAPVRQYEGLTPTTTLSISPTRSHLLLGSTDGRLQIVDAADGTLRRELKGHVGDVTSARFFPSGVVVLSGAMDMRVRIWGMDGACAAVLEGHGGRITDTAIVERGRNILTSSQDGTIRLWDCGSARVLAKIAPGAGGINQMSLGVEVVNADGEVVDGVGGAEIDPAETGTDNKLLFAVTENGSLLGYNLRTRFLIFSAHSPTSASLTSVHYSPETHCVAAGAADGVVVVWDVREPSTPITAFKRNEAAITHVRILGPPSSSSIPSDEIVLVVATGDGTLSTLSIPLTGSGALPPRIVTEYVGADVDPLYAFDVAAGGAEETEVVAAGRDGVVRFYAGVSWEE